MPGAGRGRSRRGCPTPDSQVHPACIGRRRTERELHRALLWHRSFLLTAPPRLSHSLHCGASFRPSPGAPVRTPPGARRGRVVAQCCCRTSRGSAGCARPPLGFTCPCSRAPLGRRGVRGSHQGPTAAAPCTGTKRLNPSSAGGGGLGRAGRRPAVPAPLRAARFKVAPWRSRAWAWPP